MIGYVFWQPDLGAIFHAAPILWIGGRPFRFAPPSGSRLHIDATEMLLSGYELPGMVEICLSARSFFGRSVRSRHNLSFSGYCERLVWRGRGRRQSPADR